MLNIENYTVQNVLQSVVSYFYFVTLLTRSNRMYMNHICCLARGEQAICPKGGWPTPPHPPPTFPTLIVSFSHPYPLYPTKLLFTTLYQFC